MKTAAFLGLLSQITQPVVPELLQKAEKRKLEGTKPLRETQNSKTLFENRLTWLSTAFHSLDGEVAPSAEKYSGEDRVRRVRPETRARGKYTQRSPVGVYGFSSNSVSALWGSYGRSKEWCPSRCPSVTAAFVCAGSHGVPFVTTVPRGPSVAGFWIVLPGACALFDAKRCFRDRCRRSDGFGGPKREFTWQVQGIGHVVKIVAGAMFCGRCQNVGKRVAFEGLRFTWQAQGIHAMDAMFWSRRARFLRSCQLRFWNVNLRVLLRGQCSISYDLGSWFRGRRGTFETCFHFRGSLAENACFWKSETPILRMSRRVCSFWKSGSSVFEEVSQKTLILEVYLGRWTWSADGIQAWSAHGIQGCCPRPLWESFCPRPLWGNLWEGFCPRPLWENLGGCLKTYKDLISTRNPRLLSETWASFETSFKTCLGRLLSKTSLGKSWGVSQNLQRPDQHTESKAAVRFCPRRLWGNLGGCSTGIQGCCPRPLWGNLWEGFCPGPLWENLGGCLKTYKDLISTRNPRLLSETSLGGEVQLGDVSKPAKTWSAQGIQGCCPGPLWKSFCPRPLWGNLWEGFCPRPLWGNLGGCLKTCKDLISTRNPMLLSETSSGNLGGCLKTCKDLISARIQGSCPRPLWEASLFVPVSLTRDQATLPNIPPARQHQKAAPKRSSADWPSTRPTAGTFV